MLCCIMDCLMIIFILTVALAGGQSDIKPVTGTARQNITLHTGVTGLHGDYQVVWSYGSEKHVLFNFDRGDEWRKSQRFHLEPESGSLTIQSLSTNDNGLYQGQIINGNGSTHKFNLTVVEADPIALTNGPPRSVTAGQRTHHAVGVSVGIALFIAIFGLVCFAVSQKKKKKLLGQRCLRPDIQL